MSRITPPLRTPVPAPTPSGAGPTPESYPFLRPPAADDELGRLGGYRVLRLLASGGMGLVFLAEDLALRRPVALKVIRPDLARADPGSWQRFLREARAMAAIRHDNLVTVYQAGQDGDTAFLAMELLDGETLLDRLRREGTLPPTEVARVGREVCAGLAAIHARGLVHRDIKPANLWLEVGTDRVKILDLGLVRGLQESDGLTGSGLVVGTPSYLAPEQARGKRLDARADLFALGCVLYQLCTGRVPFPGDTPAAQIAALAADDPVPVRELSPEVSPALAALIGRLLSKDAEDRPGSAAEVADQLSRAGRRLAKAAPRPRAVGPGRPTIAGSGKRAAVRKKPSLWRRARWWVAGGLVALATAAGLAAVLTPRSPGASAQHPDVATDRVYLSDLETVGAVNWPFHRPPGPPGGEGGPMGRPPGPPPGPMGEWPGPPPEVYGPVVVRGVTARHGIFMHPAPPPLPPASIDYRLGRRYARLSGVATINDTGRDAEDPVTFAVYGNGRQLWRSRPVLRQENGEAFDVPVSGVEVLRIEVLSVGRVRGAHAVWVDPMLSK